LVSRSCQCRVAAAGNQGKPPSVGVPARLAGGLAYVEQSDVAWATAGLLLVGTAPHPLGATEYKHSGCADAARPSTPRITRRKDFKHWCKDQWKLYKKSHKD